MRNFLISFILLTSFLSGTIAEFSCECYDEAISHVDHADMDSHKVSSDKETDTQTNEHCDQTCTQCHFAALAPKNLEFKKLCTISSLAFLSLKDSPREISSHLYRPPIS